ncbi:MAG TPA: tyrosine-type recombinase/integrase [Actinomycetes bacterium]|jgi:integrase|nr:tyrosine-type recombinase/integrase [Actinomycetes bacterium]
MAAKRERRVFGSVRRLASGRWQVRYRDLHGTPHTGPNTFTTKADATRYLALVEADLTRGAWADPKLGRVTFAEWAERWEQTITTLRPTTRDLYAYLLRRFLLPTFGATSLASIDLMAVQTWLAELRVAGKLSPNTIAKAYRLLSRILASAVQGGYLPHNPCVIRGAGSERAPEMKFATVAQVAKLADVVAPRFRALVLLAAYGGLRWGELVGLRVQRADLLHRTVTVAEQVTEVNGHFIVGPPKTQAGRRTVTLPDVAAAALAEHLDHHAQPNPDGLVFTNSTGGFLDHSHFYNRVWMPATLAAGVPGLRFHDLRHTAATLAIAAGANTRELMERMGHTSVTVALRYQHVMGGRDAAIAAALDRLVEAAALGPEDPAAGRSGTGVARRRRGRSA